MNAARRCLIVEDDPLWVDIIRRIVAPWDLDVTVLTDPDAAIALLRTTTFDVVLLDLQLPGGDGGVIIDRLARVGIDIVSKAILITGYPTIAAAVAPGARVVDKADPLRLRDALTAILDAPALG
jgi:ActR/RegA family two-component response regulator